MDLAVWWQQFNDPLLSQLIERALSCNYDLRLAREKICEARAVRGIVFSDLLPHIDAFTVFQRVRNSETLVDSPFLGGTFFNFYSAGFDSIWEIDLFGKHIDRTLAASFEIAAAQSNVRDVHVTVAAEVAVNFFVIRTLQERIKIAKNHINTETQILELVEDRFQAGLISGLDVSLAKALLQERLSELPTLEIRLYQTIFSLAVLLGEIPEALVSSFCEEKSLPCSEGKIPLGLPSDLLCRRGDVRAAEFAMLASGARVLAAKKELFPTLSLSGIFSYATGFFTKWANAASQSWLISPLLTLPIFHGGEILSNIQAATSVQRQAVLDYEKSVVKALEEVEGALVGYFREGGRIKSLKEEVSAYREARELSNTLYIAGVVDFLYLLDSERDLFFTEILLAESKERLMTYLVAVYKSLGGGWECFD